MVRFFKWWYRVRKMYREHKREVERMNELCDAIDVLCEKATAPEVIWIARKAIAGHVADTDIGSPYADAEENKKMRALYDVLTEVLKELDPSEEAAKEE